MSVRNFLYSSHVFKSVEFNIPVISVGNLTVGGTGKTPHTEYIVNLLKDKFDVTVLSRGYKRKTKGYVEGSEKSTVAEIGDEPKQMAIKFAGKAKVCVCENRAEGIKQIIKNDSERNVIVLDDAYQHRSVSPLINILLTDYNRPIYEDHILPYGRLRESAHNSNRANIIVVTKCPDTLKPIDRRVISKHINLLPFQSIFFTNFKYEEPKSVFIDSKSIFFCNRDTEILLITGIANPDTIIDYIKTNLSKKITHINFPDHHNFSDKDIKHIKEIFGNLTANKIIITTEKDAVRLNEISWPEQIQQAMFYLPISLNFVFNDDEEFNKQIIENVTKDKTNYQLHTTIRQF